MQDLINKNIPFAVMQCFEFAKFSKENFKKRYEIITIENGKLTYKLINQLQIDFFKQNLDKFKIALNTNDGRVYEFNNFNPKKL